MCIAWDFQYFSMLSHFSITARFCLFIVHPNWPWRRLAPLAWKEVPAL